MALVLILLALLGFTFAAVGGSSSSGSGTQAPKCVVRAGAETSPSHCPPPANP